jgi:hypothetical protein
MTTDPIPRTDRQIEPLLTYAQIDRLLKPVAKERLEGKNGMTYVPQQEVRAELTRVFGPGNWDSKVHDVTLLYDREVHQGDAGFPRNPKGDTYYIVGYRLACTLNVRTYDGKEIASFTEYHAEENAPLPNRGEAHAMALTSCESYALRRAAIGLGDAFGLHLYNGGSPEPLVKWSMIQGEVFPAEHRAMREAASGAQNAASNLVNSALKKSGQTRREDPPPQPDVAQGDDWGVGDAGTGSGS